jgi:uncharacterized SAM-binding protein YcdF (DUF218 family)
VGFAVAVALLLGVAVYAGMVFWHVRATALIDEAAPADAIVVLGAAQYNGRPSPVFGARLDHAFDLFERGYANVIITTGGYGPDPNFSEAHVGARYLAAKGIDESQIVIEQGSGTTGATVRAVARHVQAHDWERIIVVSDGFHLYRLKRMFADSGIEVLASPAPGSRIEASGQRLWFSLREVLGISAYRLARLFDPGT